MVAKAMDWIGQQAADKASPYYNKVDTEKMAAAGHSCGGAQVLANAADTRLKTYLILNAGMGGMEMAGASAKSLKNLHAPVLYLTGGPTDVAYRNAQTDYESIRNVQSLYCIQKIIYIIIFIRIVIQIISNKFYR